MQISCTTALCNGQAAQPDTPTYIIHSIDLRSVGARLAPCSLVDHDTTPSELFRGRTHLGAAPHDPRLRRRSVVDRHQARLRALHVDDLRDAGRHTLLLTPKSGGAALPVGWIDPSSRRAELLTLGAVVASSKGALGKELAVPPREHARLVEVTEATLRPYDIAVDVVRRLTAPVPVTRAAASGPRHTLPYGRRVEVAPIAVGRLAIRGGR